MLPLSMLLAFANIVAATDADELIRQGITLRRGGDDAAALERFQQAYQLEASPKAAAQIGLAEQALGRWALAYEHLNRALEATSDPWIKKNRAVMNQSLNRVKEHVGQVEILGGSTGVEVRINEVSRGRLPLAHPVAVTTGSVTIDLVASGFTSIQRITIVRAGETVREAFDAMVPLPPRARSAAAATAAKSAESGSSPDTTTARPSRLVATEMPAALSPERGPDVDGDKNSQDQAGRKAGSFRSKLKWVAWGIGAGALGVGIFGYIRQNQAGESFFDSCGVDPANNIVMVPGSNKSVTDCRGLKNQVDSNFLIEVIGLAGAGALAATGIIFWLTEPPASDSEHAAVSCSPGLTAGQRPSVACTVRF